MYINLKGICIYYLFENFNVDCSITYMPTYITQNENKQYFSYRYENYPTKNCSFAFKQNNNHKLHAKVNSSTEANKSKVIGEIKSR